MTYSSKFKIKCDADLHRNFRSDGGLYINNPEPNYKIKIPTGLKSGEEIYFLKYSRSETDYKDALIFSISRFYKRGDRTHVIIYSNDRKTGEITRFECYSSISDGSFWRFCVKNDDGDKYDKGYNYISTTFINIYLQRYIVYCKDKFDISIDNSRIKCNKVSELNKYLIDRISLNEYVCQNIFFNTIDYVFPPIEYIENYNVCIQKILEYLGRRIRNNTIESIEKIKLASNIFCELNNKNVARGFDLTDETSTRAFYNNVKIAFSKLFNDNFIILNSTKEKIYNEEFFVGSYSFWKQIYSVEIIHRDSSKKFYLYYMTYTSSTFPKFDSNIAKNIIHIIPEKKNDEITQNTINKYGLDEEYVAGGLLINKIFDYKIQAPISVLRGHDERRSGEYRFIGDLTNFDFLP